MKKPLVMMLIVLGSLAVLLAAGVAVYFFMFKSTSSAPKPLSSSQQRALQVDFPTMTTNLKDSGMIQLAVTLQGDSSSTKDDLTNLQQVIQDDINQAAHSFTSDELKAVDGQDKLAKQIESDVDQALQHGRVTKVLFTTWIVQ